MATRTTLYLVRHAESLPSEDLPEPDWPLSQLGHAQARDLARAMRTLGIEALFSSPYERARHTLEPLAVALDLPVGIAPDLRERRVTTRLLPADERRETLARHWRDPDFALPDGESNNACRARIVRALGELVDRHPAATLVAVSHGNAIAMFLQSLDPGFGMEDWRAMRNPDLFRIVYEGARATWDGSRLPTVPPGA